MGRLPHVYVIDGTARLGSTPLCAGDAARISDAADMTMRADAGSQLLVCVMRGAPR